MLIPLAAFAALLRQNPVTVDLFSGRLMPGFEQATVGLATTPRYCDVEDATLDSEDPNAPHGGDYTLTSGRGKTILIRFGSLNGVLGPNAVVTDAKLILTTSADAVVKATTIARVLKPWGEGPAFVVQPPGTQTATSKPILGAATWRARLSGVSGAGWTVPGAIGNDDAAPIIGASGAKQGREFVISGLAQTVADMASDPAANHGFELIFDSFGEFGSSESPYGKPRLVVTYTRGAAPTGGDVSIDSMGSADGGIDAVLVNHGDAPVGGLRATWTVNGLEGTPADIGETIAPGQSRALHYAASPRLDPSDERVGAVTLSLTAGDKFRVGKSMTFYPGGEPVTVAVDSALMAKFANVESARGRGLANWAQSEIDAFNELYLARSRYSISPDGARVRVRLARITETDPRVDGAAPNGVVVSVDADDLAATWPDPEFLRRLAIVLGAPDLSKTELSIPATAGPLPFDIAGRSWFPGLTGGGDTRFEGAVPTALIYSQAPFYYPALEALPSEPTSLLSVTSVGVLQALIGKSGAARHEVPPFPKLTIVSASNGSAQTLKGADLSFFQLRHGKLDATPAFTLPTGDSGLVILPNKASPDGGKSPFGTDDLVDEGAFLVRATAGGQVGWAWLKAWQLEDAAFRGTAGVATIPLRFEIPGGPIDFGTNRALGKSVTDADGSLPAKLSALVDGQGATSVVLPEKAGDWVEIDLNRDWTIGEIQLSTTGAPCWRRFRILVYQTGQKPEEAFEWAREVDWNWTSQYRSVHGPGDKDTVAYCGFPVQIRFIRIVALDDGPGSLSQIAAFPIKQK